jgi:hypothetical protein
MARRDNVENSDEARNIGPIRGDHQSDQAVSPQQDDGKNAKAGKDHP